MMILKAKKKMGLLLQRVFVQYSMQFVISAQRSVGASSIRITELISGDFLSLVAARAGLQASALTQSHTHMNSSSSSSSNSMGGRKAEWAHLG